MNKTELVNAIAEKTGFSKKDAELALKATTDAIAESLEKKESVQLIGFGTFDTVEKPERQGRNPKTGEAMTIKKSTAVKFKAGKALKDRVNG